MDKDIWLVLGLGGATVLLLPKLSRAEAGPTIFTPGGTALTETVNLYDIPGADWSLPMYATIERDIQLGFLDTLVSAGSSVVSYTGTALNYVGDTLSGLWQNTSNILTGTVVPAVVNVGGQTAEIIKTGATALWSGAEYVGTQVWTGTQWVATNVWDAAKSTGEWIWDKTAGVRDAAGNLLSDPKKMKEALEVVGALGGTAAVLVNVLGGKDSENTTNPQTVPPHQELSLIGYISKTNFNSPVALVVTKLYHAGLQDTMITTDPNQKAMAISQGYKDQGPLGYVSPEPFRNCVALFQMFNARVVDHLVITNTNMIAKLEQAGYQSHGVIGYARAA